LEPITSQIDPLRIGEDMRSMLVAEEYGERLAPNRQEAITDLTEDFPSHSFVIDFEIAQDIFGEDVVCGLSREEQELEKVSKKVVNLRQESSSPFFTYVYYHQENNQSQTHGQNGQHQGNEPAQEGGKGGSDLSEDTGENDSSGGE